MSAKEYSKTPVTADNMTVPRTGAIHDGEPVLI
jgi:hypothetical protein